MEKGPSAGFTRRQAMRSVPAGLAMPAFSEVPSSAQAASDRPNIVIVISDQFRWDCVGAMGLNPMNLTQNLDGMASRGVIFAQAFAAQPVCAPARATIFTGQYPSRSTAFFATEWHCGLTR